MQKRRIWNEFNEVVGSVDYNGNYYNINLYNRSNYDSMTFDEFWNLMDELELSVEFNVDDLT